MMLLRKNEKKKEQQTFNYFLLFRYTIASSELIRRRKIGEGAYGVVYCGRWRHIDVAIKEIKFESPEQV